MGETTEGNSHTSKGSSSLRAYKRDASIYVSTSWAASMIPSITECKDINEGKKIFDPAQISFGVQVRLHHRRQLTQTLRTPTVLELEHLRLDDKTIDRVILSSLLPGTGGRDPLRESFAEELCTACMTAMISGPRYGSNVRTPGCGGRNQISRTRTIHVARHLIPRTGGENVHTSEARSY